MKCCPLCHPFFLYPTPPPPPPTWWERQWGSHRHPVFTRAHAMMSSWCSCLKKKCFLSVNTGCWAEWCCMHILSVYCNYGLPVGWGGVGLRGGSWQAPSSNYAQSRTHFGCGQLWSEGFQTFAALDVILMQQLGIKWWVLEYALKNRLCFCWWLFGNLTRRTKDAFKNTSQS